MTAERAPFQALDSIRLGISSCLLGQEVRFNGGHVRDDLLLTTIGQHVQWVPVCPEVEIGMGIPRENIRLVGESEDPRLIAPKSGTDYTETMKTWSKTRLTELERDQLHGYVFKKDSPSKSEEHTSELQSLVNLVCRLLLEKKTQTNKQKTKQTKT